MKKIVIDPGHGGKDPGALSPTGLKESDVVLDVALRMGVLLRGKVQVIYTRKDDTFLELGERAQLATATGADRFLSIHCNSATTIARGFEVFTSPGETRADPFATALFDAYVDQFPNHPARKNISDGDPDKEARFTVLTQTLCPAALFELEFIHTPFGDAFFRDESNLDRAASALAAGVLADLGLENTTPIVSVETPETDVQAEIEIIRQSLSRLESITSND